MTIISRSAHYKACQGFDEVWSTYITFVFFIILCGTALTSLFVNESSNSASFYYTPANLWAGTHLTELFHIPSGVSSTISKSPLQDKPKTLAKVIAIVRVSIANRRSPEVALSGMFALRHKFNLNPFCEI